MKKGLGLLLSVALIAFCNLTFAQIVGTNCFVHGQYLEAGFQRTGAMGAPNAPSGYHPHGSASMCSSSTRCLASVYDWGHDGWSTGTPAYQGDYTLPGSPWEEWAIEVAGTTGIANSNSCGYSGGGGLSGSFSSWTSTGAMQLGYWNGTFYSGAMAITKEHRIDTFGSALIITVKMVNTSSSTLTDVYYMRTCDPDNDESWSGGSFTTRNLIRYQNDYYHRVMVTAIATGSASATGTPPCELSLCTKDCRAEAVIFNSWPMSTSCRLANVYARSASCLGTSYYSVGSDQTGDIAIGLVYNIGVIAPGDSAIISYAYVYNYATGIDSAFPEPQLSVAGTITDSLDSFSFCSDAPTYVNMDVLNGSDKSWTLSDWSWAPSTGLSSVTGTSVVLDESAVTSLTVYTVTGSNSVMGSCVTKTFLVTVNPISTTPPTCRDTTYCMGITAPTLAYNVTTAAGSLLWYTTATGGVGSATPPAINTSAIGVDTYYVSQTSAGSGCESARTPIHVTIVAGAPISLSNNGPLCPGDPLIVTLSDTSTATAVTYSWTGPGTFTSTSRNVTIGSCAYTDSGVYTVIVDINGCQSAPTSSTVVVHSTPPAPTYANPTYCQYASAIPLSATGSNILWYTTATGGVASAIAPTPSTASPGTYTFYVTQTINSCESARYPVVVTINPKPAPPVITNNPGEYCPNAPFQPFTIGAGTGTVTWYTTPTGGTGSTTMPTVSTSSPGTFYVYASQTLLGCEGDRTTIPILVFDTVVAHFNPTMHFGCSEDTVIFNNSSYGASSYVWDFGDGNSSILSTPMHIYPVQDTYVVKLFAHSLHCVDSQIMLVDTRHPLHAGFSYSPGIVCQGSPVTFADTSTATSPSFYWIFDDGSTSTSRNPTHSYAYTGTYHIKQIVSDLVPCIDTAYGTVVVDSLSPITVSVSDTVFCRGTYITMTADFSSIGNTGLVWNFGDGDTTLNTNPVLYAYPGIGSYTVTTTAYYRVCPPAVTSHPITVVAIPSIDLGADTTICSGSSAIVLTDYINAGTSGASWLWNTGETTSSITVTSAGTYSATVRIHGCIATDTVNITNDCHFTVPNCFSPNRDGVNDYFNPRDFFEKGLKTFSMHIYNRWGQLVFESSSTSGRGWDGMFNGIDQPEGVYVYSINATFIDGQSVSKTGNLTLLR